MVASHICDNTVVRAEVATTIRAMRLLERDAPLAELHRLRAEATTEGGRLVFVEGEAGVGKTSLLRAFRESLPPHTTTLFGSCDPLSTPRPLGPIADVAEDLGPDFDRLLRDGAPRDAVLRGLLDAFGAGGGMTSIGQMRRPSTPSGSSGAESRRRMRS